MSITSYYLLYILSLTMTQANGLLFMKKYQTISGTSLRSSTLYMIINGLVSAVVPIAVLLIQGTPLGITPYSVFMATVIVLLAATDTILRLKAYEKGQIAIVNIVAILGSIVLSCLWGYFVLDESISPQGLVAIIIMLLAVFVVSRTGNTKVSKNLLWIYVVISIASSFVTILSKQHQVETAYATIDTLSFSVWIGLVRAVIFGIVAVGLIAKNGKKVLHFPKAAPGYASLSSIISGSAYILTLFTNMALPIVITSPLSVGFGIVMSAVLPWLFFKESLNKRQIFGVLLALIGTLLFLIG